MGPIATPLKSQGLRGGRGGGGAKPQKTKGLGGTEGREKGFAGRNHFDDWAHYLLAVRGLARATVDRYLFLAQRAAKSGALESREAIEHHLKKLYLAGAGGSVRQGVVAALKSYCEWAAARGLMRENPAMGLRSPKAPLRRAVRPLSAAEIVRLIWGDRMGYLPRQAIALRNRVLLAVMYGAGLRASEVGPLRYPDDVDWDEGRAMFAVRVAGKAARVESWLWLDPIISRALGAYLAAREGSGVPWLFVAEGGRPLTRSAVRKILLQRVKESGLKASGRRISPHILRHSIATNMLESGIDIKTVQLHLRHASILTTEQYLHSSSRRVSAALARKGPLQAQARKKAASAVPLLDRFTGEIGLLAGE